MRIPVELIVDDKAIARIVDHIRPIVEKAIAEELGRIKIEAPQPAEATTPAKSPVIVPNGVDLPEAEQLKAADLRTALLLGKIPKDTGLLIDVKTTAKLLNVSDRMVYRLADQKAAPRPVKLGALVRWRLAEIIEWVDSGCPSRWQWPRPGKDRR
jgi:predicted DNA-binding transcriptional regulator AlpA